MHRMSLIVFQDVVVTAGTGREKPRFDSLREIGARGPKGKSTRGATRMCLFAENHRVKAVRSTRGRRQESSPPTEWYDRYSSYPSEMIFVFGSQLAVRMHCSRVKQMIGNRLGLRTSMKIALVRLPVVRLVCRLKIERGRVRSWIGLDRDRRTCVMHRMSLVVYRPVYRIGIVSKNDHFVCNWNIFSSPVNKKRDQKGWSTSKNDHFVRIWNIFSSLHRKRYRKEGRFCVCRQVTADITIKILGVDSSARDEEGKTSVIRSFQLHRENSPTKWKVWSEEPTQLVKSQQFDRRVVSALGNVFPVSDRYQLSVTEKSPQLVGENRFCKNIGCKLKSL